MLECASGHGKSGIASLQSLHRLWELDCHLEGECLVFTIWISTNSYTAMIDVRQIRKNMKKM